MQRRFRAWTGKYVSGSTTRTMRSLAAEKRAIRSLNRIRSRREADTFLPCRSEIAELVDGQPDRGEGKILEPLGEHLLQKIFVGEADGHVRAEVLADLRGDESCDVVDRRSIDLGLFVRGDERGRTARLDGERRDGFDHS
ncbi:MAG: hypothetical protein WAU53_00290 [Rhodoplanes sp.]